jgi:pimeloyl-ACP methyl ester carboxylesterase
VFAPASGGARLAYREQPGVGVALINPLSYGVSLTGLEAAHGQRDFLAAMGAGFQLVLYDQRGAGDSAGAGPPANWAERGADLWAVADVAGIERAVLYGVFDGGHTIAHAAAQQPERVLGLIFNFVPPVLVATAAGQPGLPAAAIESWLCPDAAHPGGQAGLLLRALGINEPDADALEDAWIRLVTPELAAAHEHLLRDGDLRSLLPSLAAPALVIEPHRRALFQGWGAALAGALPRARIVRPARGAEMLGSLHAFLATLGADVGRHASRLAPALSGAVEASERAVRAIRCIIVPVIDDLASGRAVELACRLGDEQRASIILIHVVAVPRTLPLDRPAPEAVTRGERALRLGEAIVARHGLPAQARLVPARSASFGIVEAARQERADLIVMGNRLDVVEGGDPVGPTVRGVLEHAPCQVLVEGERVYERA